jgi:uncharacterized protein
MLRRIIPQAFDFFSCFSKAADHSVEAAKLLLQMTGNYRDADPLARQIKAIEHACDKVSHEALDQLNKVFITPLDREDILLLVLRLDDVVDLINASANHMAFFDIGEPTGHSINMAKQIVRGCEKMSEAVRYLKSAKTYAQVTSNCIAIKDVENAADEIFQAAVLELFRTQPNPIQVIKWKDVYESMEAVTDRLESVANVIQSILVKMS